MQEIDYFDPFYKESFRHKRVGDLIKRELSDLLFKKIKDPRLINVTVTHVEMTRDLKRARIFVFDLSHKHTKEEVMQGIDRASGFMKKLLGERLSLRYMPKLSFYYDTAFEYSEKIERLLQVIKNEKRDESIS